MHTLMENFCHEDKDKISQMEDMGSNACFLMGYHNKVHSEYSLNDLFHYLTQVSILRASLTRRIYQLI